MRAIRLLLSRELFSLLTSPFFWIVVALAWGFTGYLFVKEVLPLQDLLGITFFGAQNVFKVQLFFIPLLTMRLLSEEKRTGTYEMLATSPVKDHEVAIAKFLAAFLLNAMVWLVFPIYFVIIGRVSDASPDVPVVFLAWAGLVLTGGVFCAVGLFASSLTQHQILAAFLSFVLMGLILMAPRYLAQLDVFRDEPLAGVGRLIATCDLTGQVSELASGILDGVTVTYQLAVIFVFLVYTVRVLEIRKWR